MDLPSKVNAVGTAADNIIIRNGTFTNIYSSPGAAEDNKYSYIDFEDAKAWFAGGQVSHCIFD